MRKRMPLLLALLTLLVLGGYGVHTAADTGSATTVKEFESADIGEQSSLASFDSLHLDTLKIELSPQLKPLAFSSFPRGYVLNEAQNTLLVYDFAALQGEVAVVCGYQEGCIAEELACNQDWLVWLETGPYLHQTNGERLREVRMMARNLGASMETADFVIDTGSNPSAEGFSLPFDSLSLVGNNLVYRYTIFQNGNRDTEVRFVRLDEREIQIVATARYADQQQILRCGLSDSLLAWDVQTRYLHQADPLLPLVLKANYDIHYLRLNEGRLSTSETVQSVALQGDYYAPLVYQGSILALQQHEPALAWTDPRKGNGDGPLAISGGTHIVNRTFDTSIVSLTPVNEEYVSQTELVRDYGYAQAVMKYYGLKALPRAIQRSRIFIGQRLLSWQSNVNEQHIVFDMVSHSFIALPPCFEDMYDDAQMIQIEETGNMRHEEFVYLPQLDFVNVRPIPGLDADYFYLSRFDTGEAYLLRIGGD